MSAIFLANGAAIMAALAMGDPSPRVLELGVHYGAPERVSGSVTGVVDGPSDRRDTIVTWSIGAQIPYGFWRW